MAGLVELFFFSTMAMMEAITQVLPMRSVKMGGSHSDTSVVVEDASSGHRKRPSDEASDVDVEKAKLLQANTAGFELRKSLKKCKTD